MARAGAAAAAQYFVRKRRRLHNAGLVVQLTPRQASLDHGASTAAATRLCGVNAVDNREGVTTLSLSGAAASSFQLTGNDLELKSGVSLTQGQTLVVRVEGSNTVKGDAHNDFTLRIT